VKRIRIRPLKLNSRTDIQKIRTLQKPKMKPKSQHSMHDDDAILVHNNTNNNNNNNKIVGNNNKNDNRRESPAREPARICGEPVRTTKPAPTKKKLPGFFAKSNNSGSSARLPWLAYRTRTYFGGTFVPVNFISAQFLFYFILF